MMKKGQLFGQPIIYIFYAIVAVLILIFGAQLVLKVVDLEGSTTESVFFNDIKAKFESVYLDSFGSVASLEGIKVPANLIEICFVDYDLSYDLNLDKVDNNILKIRINESYDSHDEENVFIFSEEIMDGVIEKLVLDEAVLCDSLEDKKVNIKLINKGEEIKAEVI